MATAAYAWFTNDEGGPIEGSVKITGREGSVEVQALEHDLHIPTDPQTGKLVGVRMHKPIKLIKQFDASSVYLYQACCEGLTLKEVAIRWYIIDQKGKQVEYFTHILGGVKVAEMRAILPSTKDPSKEKLTHMEEVSLVYSSITWSFVDPKLEYTDSWESNA